MVSSRIALTLAAIVGMGFLRPAVSTAAEPTLAEIAAEAYIYGYPLVLMDLSKQVMTAVPKPTATRAPVGQFNDSEKFPDPSFTDVVSPNADTLYSMSWLELHREPMVLSLPDTGDRYYLMQMLSGWTDVFAAPGTRTTGNRAGDFAIVGPGWQGTLPAGLKRIDSPTSLVWILGRTQTNGPSDYAAVRALKAKYKLTPLSAWGKNYTPPAETPVSPNLDAKAPPVVQAAKLSPEQFFARLAELLKYNPPAAADAPMVAKLARIGVVPGKAFDASVLDAAGKWELEQGVAKARAALVAGGKELPGAKHVNGWAVALDVGRYGVDYPRRAVIAEVGLGANLPEDAVYPMTNVDSAGQPLTGKNRYTVTFPAGQLPPVNAFWSLTMYNDHHFFVENPINRYAIGDRSGLKPNADGSLTLYLQHESPGADKEANWLPAPDGPMNLILRLYWPKPSVIDGSWAPPPVVKVN